MSSDSNKPIIKKAQELLKEHGHEVKTTHLYDIFAKLSGEKNWHVASSRKTSFEKVLNLFKDPSSSKSLLDLAKNLTKENAVTTILEIIMRTKSLHGLEDIAVVETTPQGKVTFKHKSGMFAGIISFNEIVTQEMVQNFKLFLELNHIKQGTIYTEHFSDVSNVPSNIEIRTKDQLIMILENAEMISHLPTLVKENLLNLINSNSLRDRFYLGFNESSEEANLVNFNHQGNTLFVGAMGSGKSAAMVATITSWMVGNMDQTILFVADPMKGAYDYKTLFELDDQGNKVYPQVFPVIKSSQQILTLIDLLYDEALARKESFTEVKAESIDDYQKRTKKKLTRLVTVLEEFHAITYSTLDFDRKFKTKGTAAYKFNFLMNEGGKYGIWFLACTQRATKYDVSPELLPHFVNKHIFRSNTTDSNCFLGNKSASEIKVTEKGRNINAKTHNFSQFPYLKIEEQKSLLTEHYKDLISECVLLTLEMIEKVLKGK